MNQFSGIKARQGFDPRRTFGVTLLLALSAFPVNARSAAPPSPLTEGFPTKITLNVAENARKATLFYRTVGVQEYKSVTLRRSNGKWEAQLAGENILQPAIEYFIRFTNDSGSVATDPMESPHYNPYRLAVVSNTTATILINEVLDPNDTLNISLPVGVETKALRLWVDDRDVTEASKFAKGHAIYLPLERLTDGTHALRLTGADGNVLATGEFVVRAEKNATSSLKVEVQAYSSLAYQGGLVSEGHRLVNDLFADTHIDAAAKQNDLSLFARDVDIYYAHRDSTALSMASGFTIGASNGAQTFRYGDIALDHEMPLVIGSAVRRGFHVNVKTDTLHANVFLVGANPAMGFTAAPLYESGGELYGATVNPTWPSDSSTHLSFSLVGADIQRHGSVGLYSSQPGAKGFNFGTRAQTDKWGNHFDLQWALSSIDAHRPGSPGTLRSTAFDLSMQRPIKSIEVHGKLWRYGASYFTIADPLLIGDRSGWELGAAQQGTLSWALTGGSLHNNVAKETSRPIIESARASAQMGVNVRELPSLSLTLSRANQTSHTEPNSFTRLNNHVDSVVFASGYSGPGWNIALSAGQSQLDDRGTANHDLSARNYVLQAHVSPAEIKFGGTIASTHTNNSLKSKRTLMTAGDASLPLGSERSILQAQGVILQGDLDGQLVRIGGIMRWTWLLPRDFSAKNLFGADARLTVTGNRGPSIDSSSGSTQPIESRILIGFVLGAPTRLAWPEMAP